MTVMYSPRTSALADHLVEILSIALAISSIECIETSNSSSHFIHRMYNGRTSALIDHLKERLAISLAISLIKCIVEGLVH